MRAVRRAWAAAEAGESDRGAVRESLKKLAWSRSAWHGLRTAALEELLADEPNLGDTQNMMRLMLPLETQWPVVEFICAAASERGWRGMTASLVRSWSRAVPSPADAERPERAALAALHPELDAPEIAWRTFTGEAWGGPELRDRDRRDAWALLARIDPRGERIVALARASAGGGNIAGDPLVDAVTIAARDLGAVPTSSEQLRWVERWRQPEQRAWWDEASRAIAALSDGQRVGLGLRHAALARWAAEHAPTWLTSDRSALLEELERALEGRRTVTRTSDSTAGAGGSPASGSLRAFSERASWGDAGLALVAVRALGSPGVVAQLFEQAEIDRNDRTTEYGGVIDASGADFLAQLFPPRATERLGDRRFIASEQLLEAGTGALFHYHFHAQSHANTGYAGPSGEDLEYATTHGRACLVFTFVSRDALNADLYLPGGEVLDLGLVQRPSAR